MNESTKNTLQKKEGNSSQVPLMKYAEICELLPHRPPFLLVDRVLDLKVEESIHAIKCVSALEPYFPGHFPESPIVPGVLIVEGMAQASAILCFMTMKERNQEVEKKCMLTGIEESRFRKPVVPGDTIHYFVKILKARGPFVWFSGEAHVDGESVAEVKFSAMMGNPFVRQKGATP
jgi:3-hydroxyacyl-[acyl-carrier-protein] dehydratase